jgi:hypothetical protein
MFMFKMRHVLQHPDPEVTPAPAPSPAPAPAPAPAPSPAPAPNDGDPWGGLRDKYAAGDDKKLAKLSRYATPDAALDALLGLQHRISAGEMRSTLPKNATAEQVATWRTENGIPESFDKYDVKLKDGSTISAEDKPIIDDLLKTLHGTNVSTQQANAAVDWYYEQSRKASEDRVAKDAEFAKTSQDALRAEWGNEYRLNINMVNGLISTAPAAVRELIEGARLGNGDPFMAHPDAMKWLVGLSREINPVTTVIPNAGANMANAVEDEIKSIEKVMATDRKAYNADDKMQARLRDLYDARDKLAKK